MMRQKKDGLNTKIYVIKELRNSIGKAPTQWVKSIFGAKIWTLFAFQNICLDFQSGKNSILELFFVKLPR